MLLPLAEASPTTPTAHAGWTDFSLLSWRAGGLEVRIGLLWILLVGIGLAAIRIGWRRYKRRYLRGFRTKSLRMSFKGPEVEICPDHETRRIAYQAWIEMQTRKVGFAFDPDNDVITEIYSSWYQLFGVLRELCKTIPAACLVDDVDARKLVDLLLASLNKGLRPHLTRWQARFRRWYSAAADLPENATRSPQEIQRDYPEYQELVADLRVVNREFVDFAGRLLELAELGK